MTNNWYDTKSWYTPLNPDDGNELAGHGKAAPNAEAQNKSAASGKKRGRSKKKGLTPARIAGLILLLLLVIAGSSIAFRHSGSGSAPEFFGDGGEIPDDPGRSRIVL